MSAARSVRESRHQARVAALQLLYQRELGGTDDADQTAAVDSYWAEYPASDERRELATGLFRGTVEALDRIDRLIAGAAANWRLSRMAVVDRLVLRLGTYELLQGQTPPAVVLDEAIELAKAFSGDQSAGFVNGVLDRVKRELEAPTAETPDEGSEASDAVSAPPPRPDSTTT